MKFDDMFNDFFTDPEKNPLEEKVTKIIQSLMSHRKLDTSEDNELDSIYDSLGQPDEIENFNENGISYQKHIWHKPEGHYMRIVFVKDDIQPAPQSKSLEEQLHDAVEAEEYELAVELRDQIKNQEKK